MCCILKRLGSGTFLAPHTKNSELSWSDLILMVEGIKVVKSNQKRRLSLVKSGFFIVMKHLYSYIYTMGKALDNESKQADKALLLI